MADDCWGPTNEQVEQMEQRKDEFGMPTLGKAARGYISGSDYDSQIAETAVSRSRSADGSVFYGSLTPDGATHEDDTPVRTPEARIIVDHLMSEFIDLFLLKNAKYRSVQDGYDLGDKGIIPDLNRKLGILKSRLWDGNDTVGEATDEVIQDMIGHLFLMWAKRRLTR